MPTNAQLFEYDLFRHFCISIARSSYFDYFEQLSTISNNEKNCRKIVTNAQWFHCSCSILLKRENIRVRGFHLVIPWDAGRFCVHWGIKLPDIFCRLQSVCLAAVARATKQMCIGIRFRRLKGSGINHPSKKEKLSLFALCVCPSNRSLV